jgi:murein DD-endopeptidase MepM/ murein hydrolase activator NlpD
MIKTSTYTTLPPMRSARLVPGPKEVSPARTPLFMHLFKKVLGRAAPQRTHRTRSFRFNFWTFCVALLIESIAMQLLTQLPGENAMADQVASATANATGAVATPVATPAPARLPLHVIAPPALAAAPAQPPVVAVVFHFPLHTYRLSQYFHSTHPAIDMAATTGTPIYAATVGTVAATGSVLPGGGLMVKIVHPNGFTSYYAHMSAILVRPGQPVDAQTIIGRVGSTGWATGPHLHFMLVNAAGISVNPLSYLR